MAKMEITKDGVKVRAVECPKCKDRIIHPEDKNKLEQFKDLKGRTFEVKLRMVGNSHTISIPKEIVDFMQYQEKMMKRHFDNVVKLGFEDFGRLSVDFFGEDEDEINEGMDEDIEEDEIDESPRRNRAEAIHRLALKRARRENEKRR
jgi:hypothetical protein